MLIEKPNPEKKNNPKLHLEIGDVINDSIEIYKKTALLSGLAFATLMFIITFLGIIGIGYFFRADELQEVLKNFDPEKLSTNGMIIYYTIVILLTVFASPFIAGMLKMADNAYNNLEVKFSSFYEYVNSSLFLDILLVTFFTSTFSIGLSLVSKFILPGIYGAILGFVLSYLISILTFSAIPLVLFKSLSFLDAIKISTERIGRNFFVVLLLMIVAGIFAALGIFAFCLGIFFTIPFAYAVQYSIYKRLS